MSPFVLKTPVKLKEWDGINLEEDFVSDYDIRIFNNIRKSATAEITFEVFALIANTVYLRQ